MVTKRVEVLDHGYVELVDSMGSDEDIIEAARMSTGGAFKGWGPRPVGTVCQPNGIPLEPKTREPLPGYLADVWAVRGYPDRIDSTNPYIEIKEEPGDEKLLKFLYDNKHMTPFEMVELHIEVQAPIFVFREWHRHRTQSYNEMSARYTPLPDVNYIPSLDRLMMNADGKNKQAGTVKDADELTEGGAREYRSHLINHYNDQQVMYEWALKLGVPKELARIHLPVGRYSRMRAKTDLRNWLAFLTLRMAPNAQWEIRQYANAVGQLIKEVAPRTWKLFEGRFSHGD